MQAPYATTSLPTTTSLTSSTYSTPTVWASVRVPAPGTGTPAGAVTFTEGGTILGTAALVNGNATLIMNGLALGMHTIVATYGGSGSFQPSSASISMDVSRCSCIG